MDFYCKGFALSHSKSTMKVGTDAILVSALLPDIEPKNILDVGCGCGIIALCAAQRYSQAYVTAIDIDEDSIDEAQINFAASKFKERLTAINISLQDYAARADHKYDLIVSNPPFFENSLLSKHIKRNISRHNITLSLEDFAECTSSLLSSGGRIAIILPAQETSKFITIANEFHLFCESQKFVFDTANKPCKRIVSLLVKGNQPLQTDIENIIIRNQDLTKTKQYTDLVNHILL
ncbi:MAG: methyltransferase [Bacteroidales bacterium]|nr:methyltransferase [Bacteroidales bacterium]